MTDRSVGALPPLGVGEIVGESFSLFFGRFITFFMLAFVPSLISVAISTFVLGPAALGGGSPEDLMGGMGIAGVIAGIILPMIIYGITTALIVCAAYDAKLGRPARIGQYISIALARVVPLVIVSIIVGIAVGIGFMLLVIPGIWVLAVLSVATTVVVLETLGLGALNRSIELTKEYRWPIAGCAVLLYLVILVLNFALTLVVMPVILSMGSSGLLIGLIIQAAVGAVGAAILSIGFVLIYARLRDVKEGVSVDSLVEVFS